MRSISLRERPIHATEAPLCAQFRGYVCWSVTLLFVLFCASLSYALLVISSPEVCIVYRVSISVQGIALTWIECIPPHHSYPCLLFVFSSTPNRVALLGCVARFFSAFPSCFYLFSQSLLRSTPRPVSLPFSFCDGALMRFPIVEWGALHLI